MTPPSHCGTVCKNYAYMYKNSKGKPHSIEIGWKCVVCGEGRIPASSINPPLSSYMRGMEEVRLDGIEFDSQVANRLNNITFKKTI
jgi:hypothetical protein